jgi:TPR repeat protein
MGIDEKRRIFISYKRVDKDLVFKIKDEIESRVGEKCWVDLSGIESDAQFVCVIIEAIQVCEIVLFMYSSAHTKITDFEHDYTIRELSYASKKGKRIVFINLDRSELTDWFEFMYPGKQQVDALNSDALIKLADDMRGWLNINKNTNKSDISKKNDSLKYSQRDTEKQGDIQWYLNAAMHGDAHAQCVLGEFYFYGKGVKKNLTEAINWWRKSAEQNFANAQENLGHCYFNGFGVRQDYTEAAKWYEKAAKQGYAPSQYSLGCCYYYGYGVKRSYEESEKWWLKAAAQGYESAINALR